MNNYRDYSTRLIALSADRVTVEEGRSLIARDISPEFLFLAGVGDDERLFKETETLTLEALFGEGEGEGACNSCTILKIDFLNPTSGYLALLVRSLSFFVVDAEFNLWAALRKLGITPPSWTISCTTANDQPMSAYRRSIIICNRDPDGNENGTRAIRSALFDHHVFAQLEDLMEQSVRSEIEASRFE